MSIETMSAPPWSCSQTPTMWCESSAMSLNLRIGWRTGIGIGEEVVHSVGDGIVACLLVNVVLELVHSIDVVLDETPQNEKSVIGLCSEIRPVGSKVIETLVLLRR
jgi:hypothetical protein